MFRTSSRALLLALAVPVLPLRGQGHDYRELGGGASLRYAVGLPDGYDAARSYPLLLALPPGRQDEAMVEAGFDRYWGAPARKAGWIVVSPVAPEGQSFVTGADRLIPRLLVRIRETFRIAGGRMHLAGASNGGRSAFRVATAHPYEFQSVTVLPGYPASRDDVARLGRLRGIAVRMFVGGDDGQWVERSAQTAARLRELGVDVRLEVLPGEGHVPPSLDGGVVMQHLVSMHRAPTPGGAPEVSATLDDFHDAAAKGDEDRYFSLFAPEAVFLGTDATERWTLGEFRAFAQPYFARSSAWIYVPQSRNVELSPDGAVAWFDEVLGHAQYGVCRGTGVLRRIDGAWKVAQYNLTVPVPNELMGGVVQQIAAFADGAPSVATTVVLVRHAEKQGGRDPSLTDAGRNRAERLTRILRRVPIAAVYTSEFRRTQETVAPLCRARELAPRVIAARDVDGLVARLRREHRGETVVVAGHSNTLPAIVAALGIDQPLPIQDDDYDDLLIVTIAPEESRLLRLRFEE